MVQTFAYKDALKFLQLNEHKDFYSSVDFIHMGDAELKLYASHKKSDSKIQLYNSNNLIAEGRLKSDGLISKIDVFIPRNLQPQSNSISVIKIGEK